MTKRAEKKAEREALKARRQAWRQEAARREKLAKLRATPKQWREVAPGIELNQFGEMRLHGSA